MELIMSNSAPKACTEFISYLDKLFDVSQDEINIIITDFHSEMQRGLCDHESSLKMLPSFVDRPKGNEKGKFIALDLGGTNFRVLAVELDGNGNSKILAVKKFAIGEKNMKCDGKVLFDFIASCIDKFLVENKFNRKEIFDLAFTFSFPVDQTNIAAGKLIKWTKGFTAKGVEGMDVIVLLNNALERKKINFIRVAALANDTVGTLVARSFNDPTCDIGVILGTGTNACYPEKISNIKKWKGLKTNGNIIINMEWGNFNKLRCSEYDKILDENSPNVGSQLFEKMISGMYLGEITRLVVCDLIKKELLFSGQKVYKNFNKKGGFLTEHMSLIALDGSNNLSEIEDFLSKKGVTGITLNDRILLKHICELISTRSAKLSAGAISAVLTWMDPELKFKHTVGIDGSLFEKYPDFSEKMDAVFKKLYGEKANNINLVHAKDGSGKGAAIIAAVTAQSEK